MRPPPDRHDEAPQIYCPACRWPAGPRRALVLRATLRDRLEHVRDGRVVPALRRRGWPRTQCLACSAVSPHRDWYHDPSDDPAQGALRTKDLATTR